jgi:hypothetical protein
MYPVCTPSNGHHTGELEDLRVSVATRGSRFQRRASIQAVRSNFRGRHFSAISSRFAATYDLNAASVFSTT